MSAVSVGLLGIAGLFLLMILPTPVAFPMLLVGFFGMWVLSGFRSAGGVLLTESYAAVSGYSLLVIPMFILLGNIASAPATAAASTTPPTPGSAAFAAVSPRPPCSAAPPSLRPRDRRSPPPSPSARSRSRRCAASATATASPPARSPRAARSAS